MNWCTPELHLDGREERRGPHPLAQSQAAGMLCAQAAFNLHLLDGGVGVDYW